MQMHALLRKIERGGHGPQDQEGRQADCQPLCPAPALGIGMDRCRCPPPHFCGRKPQGQDTACRKSWSASSPVPVAPPAWCVRVGAMAAAPLLLEGKMLDPKKGQRRWLYR